LALHFVGAAAGTATFNERFSELAELNFGFVSFGEVAGIRFEFRRDLAEEVKEQALTVKEVFDIDEHGRETSVGQHFGTSRVGVLTVLFEAGLEQVVLNRNAAEYLTVGKRAAIVAVIGRRQNFPHFEPAARADNDATASRIAHGVDGRETAHLAHGADSN
jgi:hypothetical protein